MDGGNDIGAEPPSVFVVDDDDAMRESIEFLLRSVDLPVDTFATADGFLKAYDPRHPGCLLVDVRMPGMSGLALQEEIRSRGIRMPVIVMTAYADVPMAVRAMRAGALDFIEKPFNDQDLLDRIYRALELATKESQETEVRQEIESRRAELSPRELEVMRLVVRGRLNKQIAVELGLSIKTVELHRAHLMEKMKARNLAELVRMATVLELPPFLQEDPPPRWR